MAIRWTAGDSLGVPSGYAGTNVSKDYFMPACNLEDADKAVFDLFDGEIKFEVAGGPQTPIKKVPVIFAAGENWAVIKKGKLIRDKQGTLVLPLIAIHRKSIKQDFVKDITGRGINQQTGELTIKRRLAPEDRTYQNLINRLGITNQDGLSKPETSQFALTDEHRISNASDVLDGEWIGRQPDHNIWEFLTIPSPQFYTATYEVTFWAQYIQHMNEMVQKLMVAVLPQDSAFKLETPKGYWFMGRVEDNNFEVEDNFDDISEERFIKCKFQFKVEAYLVGSGVPGQPAPVRRFVSAPMISFSLHGESSEMDMPSKAEEDAKRYDDPTMGYSLDGSAVPRADLKSPELKIRTITRNPFTGKEVVRYMRVSSQNKKVGESVLKPYLIDNGISFKIGG